MARRPKTRDPDDDDPDIPVRQQTVADKLREMCEADGVDPTSNLDKAAVEKFMVLTHAEKNMINLISAGFPVPNAMAVLRAIDMKLARSAPPAKNDAASEPVQITIKMANGSTPVTGHGLTHTLEIRPPVPASAPDPDPEDIAEEEGFDA